VKTVNKQKKIQQNRQQKKEISTLNNTILTLKAQVQALTSLINDLVKDKYQDNIVQRNHITEKVQEIALMEVKETQEDDSNQSEKDPYSQRKRNIYKKEKTTHKQLQLNQFRAAGSLVNYKGKRELQRQHKQSKLDEHE